eukprot:8390682-Alexandrium_andersonii.AAC.1
MQQAGARSQRSDRQPEPWQQWSREPFTDSAASRAAAGPQEPFPRRQQQSAAGAEVAEVARFSPAAPRSRSRGAGRRGGSGASEGCAG